VRQCVARAGSHTGEALEAELGARPAGFAGTHAAEILEAELASREQWSTQAGTAAQAGFRAVAAEDAAARVTGLVPTVDSLSSADVVPLDAEPLRDELANETPRPALDLERLAETSMGIPTLRDSLLDTFLAEVRPRLEHLSLALSGRDARRVEFEAHGLKGMCATMGATACAELFAELEHAGREKALELAPTLLKRAYLEVTRTERYIMAMERLAA
jgi:HPt (histidine-containing phosphotransfer) domain-containing protein